VARSNDLTYVRVGLSVSKRVGNAVKRNLVKRRIRNAFANLNVAGGWDFVVTAKPNSSTASYAELKSAIHNSIERIGIDIAARDAQTDSGVVM
jgi:ribonuclease P protein component